MPAVQTAPCATASAPADQFRRSLVEAGLLIPTGIDGLFGRSETYESVVTALSAMVHALGDGQGATRLSFPPIVARPVFERTGYLESFPNLVGAVRCFTGSDKEHAGLKKAVSAGEDWSDAFSSTDLVLCSAACHPVYPICAGRLPAGGRRFEVSNYCFRHEPSIDPARMQAFRMHEHVYVGAPDGALEHRDRWVGTAREALSGLGLEVATEIANDPFFGRAGGLLADLQRKGAHKIEVVLSLPGYAAPTAVASGNWHQDHFGSAFGIESAGGDVAHSSCVGFGLDRIALGLLATHGLSPAGWPGAVRSRLWS
jgi:seryl-tRNA synthetase